jgi:outer membrane protein assembly factor BamB
MKRLSLSLVLISLTVSTALRAHAGNWPNWRGPDGNGVASEKNLPLKWSDKENVRWRVELPGPGNSSPIVWGERVFVSQFVEKENRRTLICFDRTTGKLLWQEGITYTENEPTQENNPYCAGTPATDGERVYGSFGSAGVYAYDLAGKEVWHRDLGKLNHGFGSAISTVLHGNLCILNFGPGEKARLVALNKKTGEIAWEAQPPKVDPSEQQPMGGRFGGPPGRGGGGRGGFGPGMILAPQMLSQGDKNGDQKLSLEEFAALADAWFDKLDAEKAGKLSQEQFTAKIGDVLPPPPGSGPPGGGAGPGSGRGFGPGRMISPGLFTAADSDKDGSLTRAELKATFAKWTTDWDADKTGSVNEDQIRDGLNAALPRPNFGGPGGPGGGRGPGGRGGPGAGGPSGSWSTPVIVKAAGSDELIVNFPNRLAAYDPVTGKELWISKGFGDTIQSTPVFGEGAIVAMSSGMGSGIAIAVKPGGSGDVTETQRLWKFDRVKSGMGSGVIHDGHFYTISSQGIAVCLDLKTGNMVWEERLKGPGASGDSWSSMLLADGKIYVPNKSGDIFILRAGPKFEVLATNSVGEPTNASLAASNSELFLRTDKALWCLANPK